MGVVEADGLEVIATALGIEAVEREPERAARRDVVELAEHRDDAGNEVDGATR